MCEYLYWDKGHRSFGDDIPGYAQGAYFPGDEPGMRCRLTGEACGNVCGDAPQDCAANTRTEWLCPACQADDFDTTLCWSESDEKYFCSACKSEWTVDELPRAYTVLLISLGRSLIDAVDGAENARREADELREKLEVIRRVVA